MKKIVLGAVIAASLIGRIPAYAQTNSSTVVNSVGLAMPAGMVVTNSPVTFAGTLTVAPAAKPSIAAGAGAGTSPTVSVSGNDLGGTISILTGGSPTASAAVVTLTFTSPSVAAGGVLISPANAATSALSGNGAVFSASTATTLVLTEGSTGLAGATQYLFNFVRQPN